MKFDFKKELPLLLIIALPFLYLAYIWNQLPDNVPTHWNMKGEIDDWGDKSELILIVFLLPVLIYVILLIVPVIDPKKKIQKMGNKYQHLKFILVLFMSALAILIVYTAQQQSFSNIEYILLLIGLLIMAMGNYLKTVKPNYFIGIRTPWTLENDTVWRATHRLAGVLWFAGGLVLIAISLLLPQSALSTSYFVVVGIIVLIPVLYSYFKFKSLKEEDVPL